MPATQTLGTLALGVDVAVALTPPTSTGIFVIWSQNPNATVTSGIIAYATATPAVSSLAGGGQFDARTGVLNGTTGRDNWMTVSPHTDGKIYVENRRGEATTYGYMFLN